MEPDPLLLEPHTISHSLFSYNIQDICLGADPFIFHQAGQWHLLIQENFNEEALAHDGIKGYTVRSAYEIKDLVHSTPIPLIVADQPDNLRQVWAAEIHYEKYMYVAMSDGNNHTHRMHIYETEGSVFGPWKYIGPLKVSPADDRWAIDLTYATIEHHGEEKHYAIWSGWDLDTSESSPYDLFNEIIPQSIYIAECISPTEIGPRHLLVSPQDEWCCSVASILEGPQTLIIDGVFKGLLVTGNASWTDQYATNILLYVGGNPLDNASWRLHPQLLFEGGYGIGHGMIVQENEELLYVGHRKTRRNYGWADRKIFYTPLPRELFDEYLQMF